MSDASQWGGPAEMTAWEGLMWRVESDPRTRSTGVLLEILDHAPEPARLMAAHERAVAQIPRLRERVVEPTVPLVQPAWSPDPHFDLKHHVDTMHLAEPGDHRQLLDLCESVMRRPLDRARPPWEAILVTGMAQGRAAYLLKFHHSLTDGLGLIQLLTLAHSTTSTPGAHEAATDDVAATGGTAPSPRRSVDPQQLLSSHLRASAAGMPIRAARATPGATAAVLRAARNPSAAVHGAARFASSLRTMLAPPEAPRSPLLAGGDTGLRLLTLDVPLDQLKAAGKAAGGSINDAFVSGVVGGLRLYHERHDHPVELVPIAMPVSLRKDDDPLGGNRFAGVRFAAPLYETDPAVRIELVREFVTSARDEPAIGFLDYLSPVLTKLPSAAIIALSTRLMTTSDVQISNIRGIGHPVYLAGAKVERMYPLGPRPGVAAMIAMITYDNRCCLGMNIAPSVIADHEVFRQCLREGFDEVLALAVGPAPRTRSRA